MRFLGRVTSVPLFEGGFYLNLHSFRLRLFPSIPVKLSDVQGKIL